MCTPLAGHQRSDILKMCQDLYKRTASCTCCVCVQVCVASSASALHRYLQEVVMADGSWSTDGVVHCRLQDYTTPHKAHEYLQVCWACAGCTFTCSSTCLVNNKVPQACLLGSGPGGSCSASRVVQHRSGALCCAVLCRALQMGPADVQAAIVVPRDPGYPDPAPNQPKLVQLLGSTFAYQTHRMQV